MAYALIFYRDMDVMSGGLSLRETKIISENVCVPDMEIFTENQGLY